MLATATRRLERGKRPFTGAICPALPSSSHSVSGHYESRNQANAGSSSSIGMLLLYLQRLVSAVHDSIQRDSSLKLVC